MLLTWIVVFHTHTTFSDLVTIASQFIELSASDDEGNFWDPEPEEPEVPLDIEDIGIADEYDGVCRTRCLFITSIAF